MTEPNKIIALDVCGTLFSANTTAGFVRHFFSEDRRRTSIRFRFLEAVCKSPLRILVIALGRVAGRDLFRENYIACLKGQSRGVLKASAASYVRELEQLALTPVWEMFAKLVAQGSRPILISNSLDLVVSAIGKNFGFEWLASELAFSNDFCQGRLARDLKGAKADRLREHIGRQITPLELVVITDNKSDADLIALAGEAVIVAVGGRKSWMEKANGRILDIPA